jgi:RsiW-degrading membrane proteinase PrsW (M82 family)
MIISYVLLVFSQLDLTFTDITILLMALAPPLLILFWVMTAGKHKTLNLDMVKVFLLGVAITLLAGPLNDYLIGSTGRGFLAGITEESLKYLVLFLYASKRGLIKKPMDAIIYGVLVSLGFAAYENITYLTGSYAYELAVARAFTAVPLHAMCGIIMGFYFGLAKFHARQYNFAKALFIPMSIHASYNFTCAFDYSFSLFFIVGLFIFTQRIHKKYVSLQ